MGYQNIHFLQILYVTIGLEDFFTSLVVLKQSKNLTKSHRGFCESI